MAAARFAGRAADGVSVPMEDVAHTTDLGDTPLHTTVAPVPFAP